MHEVPVDPNSVTPGQRAYLDWMSWCMAAQQKVLGGYEPTPEEAAHFTAEVADSKRRDRRAEQADCDR